MSDASVRQSFGSYKGYYKRNTDVSKRLSFLDCGWFKSKRVLDVGCNDGLVTMKIAEMYSPNSILGIDIDKVLIESALSRIKRAKYEAKSASTESSSKQQPASSAFVFMPRNVALARMPKSIPTLSNDSTICTLLPGIFPHNVNFRCESIMETKEQDVFYDTILCLSVTKWIHLNFGDAGLLQFFKKVFLVLRRGGRLIVEYQPWKSYLNNKSASEKIKEMFKTIQIHPDAFEDVLTTEVGFDLEHRLGTPVDQASGFDRPILVLRKPLQFVSATAIGGSAAQGRSNICSSSNSPARNSSGSGGSGSSSSSSSSKSSRPTNGLANPYVVASGGPHGAPGVPPPQFVPGSECWLGAEHIERIVDRYTHRDIVPTISATGSEIEGEISKEGGGGQITGNGDKSRTTGDESCNDDGSEKQKKHKKKKRKRAAEKEGEQGALKPSPEQGVHDGDGGRTAQQDEKQQQHGRGGLHPAQAGAKANQSGPRSRGPSEDANKEMSANSTSGALRIAPHTHSLDASHAPAAKAAAKEVAAKAATATAIGRPAQGLVICAKGSGSGGEDLADPADPAAAKKPKKKKKRREVEE